MARKGSPESELLAMLAKHGAPDAQTELCRVPATHKHALGGADLACRHIAEKGTGRVGRGCW